MLSSETQPLPAREETPIVDRARLGDAAAIREIIRQNNRRLFRVARAVLRDDSEAEDVVQETYVRAFIHLDGFQGHAALSTWLTRIALNEALMRRRRRRPTIGIDTLAETDETEIPMAPSPAPGPEIAYARTETRELLQRAIDSLAEPFRLVLILRDVEGMSVEETAAQLDIRAETVKTRLFRARRMLRAYLQAEFAAGLVDLFPFDGARCERMADRVLAAVAGATTAKA